MKKIKPQNYIKTKKSISDWTDKNNYIIQYRMLKFYIIHGIVVNKIHEINSFKQNKWLEK